MRGREDLAVERERVEQLQRQLLAEWEAVRRVKDELREAARRAHERERELEALGAKLERKLERRDRPSLRARFSGQHEQDEGEAIPGAAPEVGVDPSRREEELARRVAAVGARESQLAAREEELSRREAELGAPAEKEFEPGDSAAAAYLAERQAQLAARARELEELAARLDARSAQLIAREHELEQLRWSLALEREQRELSFSEGIRSLARRSVAGEPLETWTEGAPGSW